MENVLNRMEEEANRLLPEVSLGDAAVCVIRDDEKRFIASMHPRIAQQVCSSGNKDNTSTETESPLVHVGPESHGMSPSYIDSRTTAQSQTVADESCEVPPRQAPTAVTHSSAPHSGKKIPCKTLPNTVQGPGPGGVSQGACVVT